MHALRHFYASALLEAGTSIRAVADHLGHQDPGFTLHTYTHLMPSSEDRVRQAIDAVLDDGPAGLTDRSDSQARAASPFNIRET